MFSKENSQTTLAKIFACTLGAADYSAITLIIVHVWVQGVPWHAQVNIYKDIKTGYSCKWPVELTQLSFDKLMYQVWYKYFKSVCTD